MILNLIINARDAMPGGGRITITGREIRVHEDDPIAQGTDAVAPGHYVMLSVSDTGVGMAQDVIEHVFEPFFTTKGIGKGSGLGLAMVYGFARQSGGLATIRSRPGNGTTVSILLPALIDGPPNEVTATPYLSARDLLATTGRILVVEDAADVRKIVAGQLKALGFEVIVASDGATALALLRDGTEADLLLSDLVMPGLLQGPDLADRALAEGLIDRVLFMSGYPEGARRGVDDRAGGVPVLQKPLPMDDLADAIERVLRHTPAPVSKDG
ncbi:MAG: ATP-binding protein [Pseudomonadota bacterium]